LASIPTIYILLKDKEFIIDDIKKQELYNPILETDEI